MNCMFVFVDVRFTICLKLTSIIFYHYIINSVVNLCGVDESFVHGIILFVNFIVFFIITIITFYLNYIVFLITKLIINRVVLFNVSTPVIYLMLDDIPFENMLESFQAIFHNLCDMV